MPIKDEAEALPQLLQEIKQAMKGKLYEIIAIDDASVYIDSLTGPAARHPTVAPGKTATTAGYLVRVTRLTNFKTIRFFHHQGKWAAIRAGIKASRGDIIITSDSDLQDNPREAKKLLAKFDKGYDLVSGWRKIRHDPFYKIVISKIGNLLVSILGKKKFQDLNAPFKVYRREVIEAVPKEGSLLRFSMLFAHKMGYKTAEVSINHRPRIYGKSKFGVIKYLRIIYDLVLVFLLFSGSGRLIRRK